MFHLISFFLFVSLYTWFQNVVYFKLLFLNWLFLFSPCVLHIDSDFVLYFILKWCFLIFFYSVLVDTAKIHAHLHRLPSLFRWGQSLYMWMWNLYRRFLEYLDYGWVWVLFVLLKRLFKNISVVVFAIHLRSSLRRRRCPIPVPITTSIVDPITIADTNFIADAIPTLVEIPQFFLTLKNKNNLSVFY